MKRSLTILAAAVLVAGCSAEETRERGTSASGGAGVTTESAGDPAGAPAEPDTGNAAPDAGGAAPDASGGEPDAAAVTQLIGPYLEAAENYTVTMTMDMEYNDFASQPVTSHFVIDGVIWNEPYRTDTTTTMTIMEQSLPTRILLVDEGGTLTSYMDDGTGWVKMSPTAEQAENLTRTPEIADMLADLNNVTGSRIVPGPDGSDYVEITAELDRATVLETVVVGDHPGVVTEGTVTISADPATGQPYQLTFDLSAIQDGEGSVTAQVFAEYSLFGTSPEVVVPPEALNAPEIPYPDTPTG